jgi:hypothetical protein
MKYVIWVLWPAFIAAGIAEVDLLYDDRSGAVVPVRTTRRMVGTATYSTGFLLFWLVCIGSSLMTYLMMPRDAKEALMKAAGEREDLARPKRREPAQRRPLDQDKPLSRSFCRSTTASRPTAMRSNPR